jgi:hypothetical protein
MKSFTEQDIYNFLDLIAKDKTGPSVVLAKHGYAFSNIEKDDIYTSVNDMCIDVMRHFVQFLNSK